MLIVVIRTKYLFGQDETTLSLLFSCQCLHEGCRILDQIKVLDFLGVEDYHFVAALEGSKVKYWFSD